MITKTEHLADYLFGLIIKTERGWMCDRCGQEYSALPELNLLINIDGYWHTGLEASHFIDRQYQATRFTKENVDVLCTIPCHRVFESQKRNGMQYYAWKASQLRNTDTAIEDLIQAKHKIVQRKRFDYVEQVETYIADLKSLGCATGWILKKYGKLFIADESTDRRRH